MRVGASVCLCVLPMTGTDSAQHPGPLSVEAAGRAERQALGWGHAHALFPGLEGWLRLGLLDLLAWGPGWWERGCPCTCLGSRPPGHKAHRLLRATLGSAWGLLHRPARPPGLGKVRSPVAIRLRPAELHAFSRTASTPIPALLLSEAHRNLRHRKGRHPQGGGAPGRSPGSILLMPLSGLGFSPCRPLPAAITRGGGPEEERGWSLLPLLCQ